MKSDGPRWELTQQTQACACGTRAGILRNCRSGSRVAAQHLTPKRKRCYQPIASVVSLEELPEASAKFPGEKFAIATVVIRSVYSLDSADQVDRNIEVTGQPFNREPLQLELFPR